MGNAVAQFENRVQCAADFLALQRTRLGCKGSAQAVPPEIIIIGVKQIHPEAKTELRDDIAVGMWFVFLLPTALWLFEFVKYLSHSVQSWHYRTNYCRISAIARD